MSSAARREPLPFFVNGTWTVGRGRPIVSTNPANGETIAVLSTASAADIDAAVAAARAALTSPAWQNLHPHERARLLSRVADLMAADAERIARRQVEDTGKTIRECRAQVASAAATFRFYAAACETFEGEVTPPRGNHLSLTTYEPAGVVAAITPWNSPLTLEAQKLAPILAAGNCVVLKPSEVAPLTGLEYARLAEQADLPTGVVNVVTGGVDVGRQLVEHRGVDMVSFTGGTAGGRAIAEAAGRSLKPVVLELGGKSPHIIFADADIAKAAKAAADGIFSGSGQSCVAGSRIFVEEPVFDDVLARLEQHARALKVGDPRDEETGMGPLVNMAHRDRVAGYVAAGLAEGGRIVAGGSALADGEHARGAYFAPTVLTGLPNSARVCREEIFGPVAVVLPFADEADLVAQANDTDFGLACGIWTSDYRRALRIGRAVQAGTVWVNTYKELSISTPFGGFKQSGLWREKGLQGMRIYMQPKALFWSAE